MNRRMDDATHCAYPFAAIVGKASCFIKNLLCDNCTTTETDQVWNIPDCLAGGTVSISETEKYEWAELNGNRLIFNQQTRVSSVQVFELSMRLLAEVPVNGSNQVQLPFSLRGCMLVKIDAENSGSEVKKWCNF